MVHAPVAQLDRAPGFEPGGRGFESCRGYQNSYTSTNPREFNYSSEVPRSSAERSGAGGTIKKFQKSKLQIAKTKSHLDDGNIFIKKYPACARYSLKRRDLSPLLRFALRRLACSLASRTLLFLRCLLLFLGHGKSWERDKERVGKSVNVVQKNEKLFMQRRKKNMVY